MKLNKIISLLEIAALCYLHGLSSLRSSKHWTSTKQAQIPLDSFDCMISNNNLGKSHLKWEDAPPSICSLRCFFPLLKYSLAFRLWVFATKAALLMCSIRLSLSVVYRQQKFWKWSGKRATKARRKSRFACINLAQGWHGRCTRHFRSFFFSLTHVKYLSGKFGAVKLVWMDFAASFIGTKYTGHKFYCTQKDTISYESSVLGKKWTVGPGQYFVAERRHSNLITFQKSIPSCW